MKILLTVTIFLLIFLLIILIKNNKDTFLNSNKIGYKNDIKVFVIHYKKLIDRKKNILKIFKKHNITNFEFIDQYDRDNISQNDNIIFEKDFSDIQKAICLSHIFVYKQIAHKYNSALILEDDVILHENFLELFYKYINQLPSDYDMIFFGNCCNLHISDDKLVENINIYEKTNFEKDGLEGSTRCTDCYLISKKCALKIEKYIENLKTKINSPIDFWLNIVCKDNKFRVFWAEPTIAIQGSENNIFKPSYNH